MVQSIILTGPTAVGKSALAIEIAESNGLEIINADSVAFYQHFNIGAAKPSDAEMERVRHHLINIAHPLDVYHAGQFLRDCMNAIQDIHARGKRALIVGGSGFYLKALRLGLWDAPSASPEFRDSVKDHETQDLFQKLSEVDAVHAKKIGKNDRYRIIRALEIYELTGKIPSDLEAAMGQTPRAEFQLWVVDRDKNELEQRIESRVRKMLDEGFIEETVRLREQYPESKTLNAVGYAQVIAYLDGVKPEGRLLKPGVLGLIDEIILAHRQLAKQQRTWFKNLKPNENFILDQDSLELKEKLISFYQ